MPISLDTPKKDCHCIKHATKDKKKVNQGEVHLGQAWSGGAKGTDTLFIYKYYAGKK